MPYAKIALDITELIADIESQYDAGDEDSFVIVLNESILELDYSVCAPGETEDPWGGCAIANGTLTNVTVSGFSSKLAYASEDLSTSWGSNYVMFSYSGSSNNCLNDTLKTSCFSLGPSSVSENPDYFNVGETTELLAVGHCNSDSRYYVYDNVDCEQKITCLEIF